MIDTVYQSQLDPLNGISPACAHANVDKEAKSQHANGETQKCPHVPICNLWYVEVAIVALEFIPLVNRIICVVCLLLLDCSCV